MSGLERDRNTTNADGVLYITNMRKPQSLKTQLFLTTMPEEQETVVPPEHTLPESIMMISIGEQSIPTRLSRPSRMTPIEPRREVPVLENKQSQRW